MESNVGVGYARSFEQQVVNGYRLLRQLGGSDHSLVFLTEGKQDEPPRKAAVKLVPVSSDDEAASHLSEWEAAAAVTHPQLMQLFEWGRCKIAERPFVYVVMEYADEDLSQILPIRALSKDEVRQMLPAVIDVLRFLHSQGFVHGHLRPSNIMAVGDQIKISGDGLGSSAQARVPGPYDPPEAATTGFSPAGDVWSLAATVVATLTQLPPEKKDGEPVAPPALPPPFAEIARHGLRRNPEQRWSLDEIAASLTPPPAPTPAPVRTTPTVPAASPAVRPSSPTQPEVPRKSGRMIAVVAAVAIAAVLIVLLGRRSREPQAQDGGSSPTQSSAPQEPGRPEPAQSAPTSQTPENTSAAKPAPQAPVVKSGHAGSAGTVMEQSVPEVPREARSTIRGTIRVDVRATVDSTGSVSNANLMSGGPSRYFANLALHSAQNWKFAAGQPGTRVIRFEFRQSGTHASVLPAKR